MILINNTLTNINIEGQIIGPSEQYSVQDTDRFRFAQSSVLVLEIALGNLTVNDGFSNLSASEGIDLIKNYFPKKVGLTSETPLGTPLVAMKKPDGNSFTLISHNFCDNTTWPATNNSLWSCAPPAGKIYKVLRAEVQFTHDVQLKTLSPTPAVMELNVMAGGSPVDTKLFASITDVFDLGNKHYTMNATVDGVPGITTVTFDYADAIVLKNSLNMSIDFEIQGHTQLGGAHCSVSVIVEPIDE